MALLLPTLPAILSLSRGTLFLSGVGKIVTFPNPPATKSGINPRCFTHCFVKSPVVEMHKGCFLLHLPKQITDVCVFYLLVSLCSTDLK